MLNVCTDPIHVQVGPCMRIHESDTPNPEQLCGWDNRGSSMSSVTDPPITIYRRESHNGLRSFCRSLSVRWCSFVEGIKLAVASV